MYCKKCGSELRDDAVFCLKCGTQIKAEVNNISKVEKTTNKKMVLLVAGCIALVLGIVIALTLGMKRGKNEIVKNTEAVEYNDIGETVEETQGESAKDEEEPKMVLLKSVSYGSDGSISVRSEYEYDNQGNMIKKIEYDSEGNIIRYEEWDSMGNVLEDMEYRGELRIEYGKRNEYDEKGNILRSITAADMGVDYDCVYEYDNDGNLIRYVQDSVYDDSYSVEYTYDDDGNCIKEVYLKPLVYDDYVGEHVEQYEHFYNDMGQLVFTITQESNVNYNYKSETTYEYDEKGNKISVVEVMSDGGLVKRINYEYLENGVQRKYIEYGYSGEIILWIEDFYDNEGKVIKKLNYERSEMGSCDLNIEYTYDSNGYLIKEKHTSRNMDGTYASIDNIKYTNDSKGNVMKKVSVKSIYSHTEGGAENVNDVKTEEDYNSEGILIRQVSYDINGEVASSYEYDDYGNLTKDMHYNRDGCLTAEFKYVYDEYGNVLKVTNYTDGQMDGYTEYAYTEVK